MILRKNILAVAAGVALFSQTMMAYAELPDFTPLVRDASRAVVNISTKQSQPMRGAQAQMPDLEGIPPMFREFFERGMPQQPDRQPEAQSLGSGFIIS